VPSLTFLGADLYAGGAFTSAGGVAVHVGGSFVTAGGKPSYGFALWHPPQSDRLEATVGVLPGGDSVIAWSSDPDRVYQGLSTTNLAEPFVPFGDPIPAQSPLTSFTHPVAPSGARFFQVREAAP
jgi:hypothetical protein